jgi:hypothetical protein
MGMEGFALLFAIMALAGLSLLGYEYRDTNTISLSPRGWLVLIFDKLLYRLLRIDNPQKARIWGWRMFLGSLILYLEASIHLCVVFFVFVNKGALNKR